jgi:hypothetical protein
VFLYHQKRDKKWFFVVVSVLIGVGLAPACWGELVGHWKLDEGQGDVFRDSVGGNDGFLYDDLSPVYWVTDAPPVQNFAAEFDGIGAGIVTDFPGIGGNDPRTVTFWVKTDVPDDEPSSRIVAWGASVNEQKWHIRVNENEGNGNLGAIRTEVQGGQNVATTRINDNQWHHIAVVFPDGGQMNSDVMHYVDGTFDPQSGGGDQFVDTLIGPAAEPVSIGFGIQGANPTFFPGLLADVRIYDEALDEAAIAAIMAGEGIATMLQPGDADQDFDFDQLDLVRVQIAAKYLTGQAATWGEGDWDAAPGGSAGSPPPGNGLFDQLDIIAALGAGIYLTGPYAAISDNGVEGDGQTSIKYFPATGEVAVDAPAGVELTSINIDSAAAIFTGQPAQNLGGSFDNDSDDNIFKATFGSSFGSLSFGNVAQAGLSKQFVLDDLTVVGSLDGGGSLGDVDLVYVPEPAALLLLSLGVVGLLAIGRRG